MNLALPTKNVCILFNFLSTASLKFNFYKTGETMGAIPTYERVRCIFMFSAHGFQIPAELIKVGGRTISCEIHKLIISIWNKEELPEEWKSGS
jgi:hypothetical protein